MKQLIKLGFNLKIPYQNVFLLYFLFFARRHFVGNHWSVENLLCFTGSHYCALQVSQQGCQQERKRFTARYFIYVSQNCLCRDGDMVRKEAKRGFVGFQQQTALVTHFTVETLQLQCCCWCQFKCLKMRFSISSISISIIVLLSAWLAIY